MLVAVTLSFFDKNYFCGEGIKNAVLYVNEYLSDVNCVYYALKSCIILEEDGLRITGRSK